jgi:hypothetical protein
MWGFIFSSVHLLVRYISLQKIYKTSLKLIKIIALGKIIGYEGNVKQTHNLQALFCVFSLQARRHVGSTTPTTAFNNPSSLSEASDSSAPDIYL